MLSTPSLHCLQCTRLTLVSMGAFDVCNSTADDLNVPLIAPLTVMISTVFEFKAYATKRLSGMQQ